MSWLGDVWKRNRNFVGNALKNVAPVVGALTGGVGGVAIGGLGAALGQAAREGSNIGDILKTGVQNAGITKAAQSLGGERLGSALKSAMRGNPGIQNTIPTLPVSPPTTPPVPTPSYNPAHYGYETGMGAPPGVASLGPVTPSSIPVMKPLADPSLTDFVQKSPQSATQRFWKGLKKTGSWVEKNPESARIAMQTLGKGIEGLSGAGERAAAERRTNAEAARLEYQLAQEQERQKSLEGLRAILAQQMPEFGKKRKHVWETDV